MTAAIGVDAGASLAKLAIGSADPTAPLEVRCEVLRDGSDEAIAERVSQLEPQHLAFTGCRAASLSQRLGGREVHEFDAWAEGARTMLAHRDLARNMAAPTRFIVVSVGTGTSCILVDGETQERAGGTAFGGGTLFGLGRLLTGCEDFAALSEAAERGDAARADLLIGDIYEPGKLALPGWATAANFGRIGRPGCDASSDDLAAALMNLASQTIGMICSGVAARAEAKHVVFGGTTLRANPLLRQGLSLMVAAAGQQAHFLSDIELAGSEGGAFPGAVGAYELARQG